MTTNCLPGLVAAENRKEGLLFEKRSKNFCVFRAWAGSDPGAVGDVFVPVPVYVRGLCATYCGFRGCGADDAAAGAFAIADRLAGNGVSRQLHRAAVSGRRARAVSWPPEDAFFVRADFRARNPRHSGVAIAGTGHGAVRGAAAGTVCTRRVPGTAFRHGVRHAGTLVSTAPVGAHPRAIQLRHRPGRRRSTRHDRLADRGGWLAARADYRGSPGAAAARAVVAHRARHAGATSTRERRRTGGTAAGGCRAAQKPVLAARARPAAESRSGGPDTLLFYHEPGVLPDQFLELSLSRAGAPFFRVAGRVCRRTAAAGGRRRRWPGRRGRQCAQRQHGCQGGVAHSARDHPARGGRAAAGVRARRIRLGGTRRALARVWIAGGE